jgi:hypothetical protein
MRELGIEFFESKAAEYRAQKAAEGFPLPERDPHEASSFDAHFIKAVATHALYELTSQFYNAEWVVLNNITSYRFLTSDNPAASFVLSPVVPAAFRFLPLSRHHPRDGVAGASERNAAVAGPYGKYSL